MSKCRALAASLALLVPGIAVGCGGGGGDPGPTAQVGGHYFMWINLSGEELGPFPAYFEQTGNVIDGPALWGTVSGSNFTIHTQPPGSVESIYTGTMVGTTATGTISIPVLSINGTFRMQAYQPAGTMVVNGTISGEPTGINAIDAYGAREYSDQALTQLNEIEVSYWDVGVAFELDFLPTGLMVGTLDVSTDIVLFVDYVSDTASMCPLAVSGTVTVTQYDSVGFAATFNVLLSTGDTISGSFDVIWDIEAYEP